MERGTRKILSIVAGLALMAGSGMGLVQGVRAGAAQALYRQTKPAEPGDIAPAPETAAETCAWADRLYPHNYYFSIWMGEHAWYERFDSLSGREIPARVELAARWCERGLRQNHYDRQLRALKTQLLARRSPAEAAAYWADYVDWDFWEPHNHAVLVELHARAGDYDLAMASLQWVKGTRHEAEARKRLEQIVAAESRLPRAAPRQTAD